MSAKEKPILQYGILADVSKKCLSLKSVEPSAKQHLTLMSLLPKDNNCHPALPRDLEGWRSSFSKSLAEQGYELRHKTACPFCKFKEEDLFPS